jgi:regulatory protein
MAGRSPHEGPRPTRRAAPAERRAERAAVDDPAAVLDAGLRFLEVRSRSTQETRRRLLTAGYRPELVEGAVERLLELGLLDDEAFARAWVASRDRAHPRGERALRAELLRKGIERALVDAALAEREGGGPEGGSRGLLDESSADETAARRLLERRRAALERAGDARMRRQRAYALLARSGFDPEIAAREAARFANAAEE